MSKIKNGGLDQYGAGPFEQQQFETAGVERVKPPTIVGMPYTAAIHTFFFYTSPTVKTMLEALCFGVILWSVHACVLVNTLKPLGNLTKFTVLIHGMIRFRGQKVKGQRQCHD